MARNAYRSSLVGNVLDASLSAFGDTFFLCTCIAIFGALGGIILRKPKIIEERDEKHSNLPDG
jgi:hypothetical protein